MTEGGTDLPAQQPEPQTPNESSDITPQLQEITTDMDHLFQKERESGTGVKTNPDLYRVSFLQTDNEATRIQWCNNLANIGAPEDEQVYEIRRELSKDRYRTDQKVLTIYKRPDSPPRAVLILIRGSVNSADTMESGSYIPANISPEVVSEFKGVLENKQAAEPTDIPERFQR